MSGRYRTIVADPTDWPEGHRWSAYEIAAAPEGVAWERCSLCSSLRVTGVTHPSPCKPYFARPLGVAPDMESAPPAA